MGTWHFELSSTLRKQIESDILYEFNFYLVTILSPFSKKNPFNHDMPLSISPLCRQQFPTLFIQRIHFVRSNSLLLLVVVVGSSTNYSSAKEPNNVLSSVTSLPLFQNNKERKFESLKRAVKKTSFIRNSDG
jgi:hypothetical protein